MAEPLTAYMRDHLAGGSGAIALLSRLCREWRRGEVGAELRVVLAEVRADHRVLQNLIRASGGTAKPARLLFGRMGEKVLGVRTRGGALADRDFRLFESLEVLVLGIAGKRALWQALRTVSPPAVHRIDLDRMERRALDQLERVDRLRLAMAAAALRPEA